MGEINLNELRLDADFAAYWEASVVKERLVDVGVITTASGVQRAFLNAVTVGLPTKRVAWWRKLLPNTNATAECALIINHERIAERLRGFCLGNGPGYGWTPRAVPYDGVLDITLVSPQGDRTPHRTMTALTVESTGGLPIYLDGQLATDLTAPFTVTILQEKVNVCVKPDEA